MDLAKQGFFYDYWFVVFLCFIRSHPSQSCTQPHDHIVISSWCVSNFPKLGNINITEMMNFIFPRPNVTRTVFWGLFCKISDNYLLWRKQHNSESSASKIKKTKKPKTKQDESWELEVIKLKNWELKNIVIAVLLFRDFFPAFSH